MDAMEAIGSAVSMRWLKPDPVPDDLVESLIWAATRASNPANVQPWDFVVVRDEELRRELTDLIMARFRGTSRRFDQPLPEDPTERRMLQGGRHLIEHFAEAPVLVFVCGKNVYPPSAPQEHMMYSAVFGAAQNLMVAARALGLGAAYTTFHLAAEQAVKSRLGVPDSMRICVTIPVGWPGRQHGTLSRRPLSDVVHFDHW
jgi:nitroreductase